jgi:hypothetical protein
MSEKAEEFSLFSSAFYDKNFTNILDFRNHWNQVMILKHLFVASMIIIHFYRGLILNPKIGRLSAEIDEFRMVFSATPSSN